MTEMLDAGSDVVERPMPIPPGPGASLREAREARNWSVADVKSALRLKDGVVEALERDNYHGLPAPIFVKGYLRSYARLVGVGEEPVLASYQARGPSEPPPLAPAFPRSNAVQPRVPWPKVLVGLVVLAGIAAFFMVNRSTDTGRVESAVGTTAAPAVAESGASDLVATSAPARSEAVSADIAASEPVTETVAMAETEHGVVVPLADVPPEPVTVEVLAEAEHGLQFEDRQTAVESAPAVVVPEVQLGLSFEQDCWTEIRDADGKRLLFGLIKGGTTHTVSGKPPFSVLLGNASAVRLTVDGEAYNLQQHIKRNVARFELDVTRSAGSA